MKRIGILGVLILLLSSCHLFTKDEKQQHEAMKAPSNVLYTCPMHPEIVQDHPGTCPLCKMDLEQSAAVTQAPVYTCPMHPEIVQDHPGTCPLCKMDLEQSAAVTQAPVYTCPMHPEIVQDHPGTCPLCKMDLEQSAAVSHAPVYTCPMHPEIVQDHQGTCPLCKMDLVQSVQQQHHETEFDRLTKSANQYVMAAVNTVEVKQKTLTAEIPVTGKISYDPREVFTLSAKVSGRVEKLYVKYLYQPISKGQKLMELYSKELLTEQENYIYLLKNDPSNQTLLKTAEERLLLQGLTPEQIHKLKSEKKAIPYITVYSPISGHLHNLRGENFAGSLAMNNTENLSEALIREGMYVQKGQAVFSIYNTHKLWALLNLYAPQTALVKAGQEVQLNVDGRVVPGSYKINFIEPEIRSGQNMLTARVYISNENGSIMIGANVKGQIMAGEKTGFFIPTSSIVDLGNRQMVFLKEKEVFRAHQVQTGSVLNHMVEIISGLKEHDLIAENAQFLIDSESFIKTDY